MSCRGRKLKPWRSRGIAGTPGTDATHNRRRPSMNAYTARGQARMQLHDVSAVLQADGLPAGAALATLEWHRGYQADAEVARLLRQHDGAPQARESRVALLRQAIGTALVRAGPHTKPAIRW